jgi:Leucine-rich repeat (LRR) protein
MLNASNDNKAFQPLRNLTLSGNQLTQIPKQIKHFPSVREVNLADNKLTSVFLNEFNFAHPNQPPLGRLVLSNNKINHIDGLFQSKFYFYSS